MIDDSDTRELYAGRRLVVCPPGFDRYVKDTDDQPLFNPTDVWLTDPLMPTEQAVIIEPVISPETLHRLIFGPGDGT